MTTNKIRMKIIKTEFKGLNILQPKIYKDQRGYFFESYKQDLLLKEGIEFNPVQDNESKSVYGVVRGLHFQLEPFAQAKLVRVVMGRIYDVAVDLRRSSPTFGKYYGMELDSERKYQVFIPKGFAHGFSVLSDIAVIQYKCDNPYNPEYERGINVFDPELNIDWKLNDAVPVISEKDRNHPYLKDAEINFL